MADISKINNGTATYNLKDASAARASALSDEVLRAQAAETALDGSAVKLTGVQSISGNKSFTGSVSFSGIVSGNAIGKAVAYDGGRQILQSGVASSFEDIANDVADGMYEVHFYAKDAGINLCFGIRDTASTGMQVLHHMGSAKICKCLLPAIKGHTYRLVCSDDTVTNPTSVLSDLYWFLHKTTAEG